MNSGNGEEVQEATYKMTEVQMQTSVKLEKEAPFANTVIMQHFQNNFFMDHLSGFSCNIFIGFWLLSLTLSREKTLKSNFLNMISKPYYRKQLTIKPILAGKWKTH